MYKGISDDLDNCPTNHNPGQENTGDTDSVGDACDNCKKVNNDDQQDFNHNWFGDACETVGGLFIDKWVIISHYIFLLDVNMLQMCKYSLTNHLTSDLIEIVV